jgi:hypothetical protein
MQAPQPLPATLPAGIPRFDISPSAENHATRTRLFVEDQLAARQAQQLEAQQRTQANPFGGPVSSR